MEESSGGKGRRKKRLNLEVNKEDRISDLPDCLLHHIISFLPSTAEAIRTGILSKRWLNQWTRTHVPILVFDCNHPNSSDSGMCSFDISNEDFARSIDTILLHHQYCSKIMKLHLGYNFKADTNFSDKLRFAMSKHVDELILHCCSDPEDYYELPKLLYENDSLVKLDTFRCYLKYDWSINWGSLKALKISEGGCNKKEVANVLSGTPSLESLELNACGGGSYAIASKSLKILILEEVGITNVADIEISCPNLEELSIKSTLGDSAFLPDEVIENFVSSCLFLCSLELDNCFLGKFVIASTSLKKLVLRRLISGCKIEIRCPHLEQLNSYGSHYETFKLMNIPSLICGNPDSEISQYLWYHEDREKKIFEQLHNVKELTMESWFIKILSGVGIKGLSYTWSKNKILTLNGPNFEHLPGIICALRSSRNLERLVIKLQVYEGGMTSYRSRENCSWNSNGTVLNCLLRHLKTVEIIGLSK